MANLLEPWVLLSVIASAIATLLLARAGSTALLVLRRFDVQRATEGQLALERRLELASTFVRVSFAIDLASLLLFALSADKLSHAIRGAMCGYGVFAANDWGFRALFAALGSVFATGLLAQAYAFDARVRGMDLARPLSVATIVAVPIGIAKIVLVTLFLTKLDLTVVASCCSVDLDTTAADATTYAHGPRELAAWGAPAAAAVAVAIALLASRRPTRGKVAVAGASALFASVMGVAAAVLEVAPHAFETPRHVCPFCLLKPDVLGVGYPLFGALLFAALWAGGAGISAIAARTPAAVAAWEGFARTRLRREAAALVVAVLVGAAPVVRYAIVSGGAPLFR